MRKRGETVRMIYIRGSEIRATVRKRDVDGRREEERQREGERESERKKERREK